MTIMANKRTREQLQNELQEFNEGRRLSYRETVGDCIDEEPEEEALTNDHTHNRHAPNC